MGYLTYLLLCMSPIIIQLYEGKLLFEGKLPNEVKLVVPCTPERTWGTFYFDVHHRGEGGCLKIDKTYKEFG